MLTLTEEDPLVLLDFAPADECRNEGCSAPADWVSACKFCPGTAGFCDPHWQHLVRVAASGLFDHVTCNDCHRKEPLPLSNLIVWERIR